MSADGPGGAGARRERSLRRGTAREDAILAAVFELVPEIGYERITVDQIAARAKASKATMYKRWPGGKAEIVADALRRDAQARELTGGNTGSMRGDLLSAVAGITSTVSGTDGGPSLIGLVEGVRDDPLLRDLVRRQIDHACTTVGDAICESARARGERPALPSAAPILQLAIAEILLRVLLTGSAPGKAAQRRLVDELLLPLMKSKTEIIDS